MPRFHTPEPGEVERFLESVIGSSPAALELPERVHTRLGDKPTSALATHDLPTDHLLVGAEHPSSSMLCSSPQTVVRVNNLPSADPTLDHSDQQSPVLGGTRAMTLPSASTIEECRKRLVPVLLSYAQARFPEKRLDTEQYLRLLSDDQCKNFFRQAKEMRLELSSLISQKTSTNQGWGGSLERDGADGVDVSDRNTRSRFSSTNTVVADASRKDSEITLADFTGERLPPKAPRALLQVSQTKRPDGACGAREIMWSPTTKEHTPSSTSLFETVCQATSTSPTPMPTSEPVTEIDRSMAQSTGDQSGSPGQPTSPTYAASSTSTDFVSHLPTQPGVWFKRSGTRYAEVVDVHIEISDEMFYLSTERRPSRLRMHLRLCSVPVDVVTKNKGTDTLASLQDVDDIVQRHALHWPKKGGLIVRINSESERSKTWLPHTLESDPLDVTSCVRPGKNTFRFIQLSDLSDFMFVLVASPPPPEEEWRSWDWASLVERSRARSLSSMDDSANDLSEFAHIPVFVRS